MTDTLLEQDGGFATAGESHPLSATQERIWFDEQLRVGGTAYHMPVALRVHGPLDTGALRSALRTVAGRHDVLRTVFEAVDGLPLQRVGAPAAPEPTERDLRALPDPRKAARIEAEREIRRPFDLSAGPLLRLLVLRTGEEEHLLVLTVHHLIFDGGSFGVLFEELGAAYAAALDGREPELRALRRSFAEAVRAERRHADEQGDASLDWWRAHVADLPLDAEPLPADHPRPARRDQAGAQQRLLLDPEPSAAVLAFGRAQESTLFTTVLSAFGVVLARQSGLDRLLLGTPVSTRRAADRGTLGCFLATLPVRLDVDPRAGFADHLAAVKRSALASFAHQEVPLARLSAGAGGGPDANRLLRVLFNAVPPVTPPALRGCTVEQLPFPEIDNKFDLTLYVSRVPAEAGERLALDAVYDAQLYRADRIADLLEQVALVLAQAAADPSRRIADLDLRTGRARALAPVADAELTATRTVSLPSRLAAHAATAPGRPALLGAQGTVSYGELEEWTARLARRLVGVGIGRGDAVAVQASRGPAAVAAILAVMRTGAAFVLLDADHPEAELSARAESARPRAWILAAPGHTPASASDGLPVFDASAVRTADAPDEHDAAATLVDPSATDPAYITFTSGTTGRPRRVIGDHGPLTHFLDWYTRAFAVTADDRFSALSGIGHDPFLRDVLAPLWSGAAAVLPEADVRDTEALAAELRDRAVTVAHLTPALAGALAAAGRPGWPTLRLVGFGGDVLTWRTVREWAALAPEAELLNLYGATETPQAVSVHRVRRPGEAVPAVEGRVPLGPGIDEVHLLVLRGDRPAALGEIGEVVVRTRHLARYADPDVADAQDAREAGDDAGRPRGGRFAADHRYRTGDLGRLRPDGLVDFLGRADDQIKVRGHRIEPGEVEAALAAMPGVRQAVVLTEPDPQGGHRLIGCLATGADRPDLALLREQLARRLPEYRIPSAFVVVESIPLTANRKPDRAALLALGRAEVPVGTFVAPAGPVEQGIARVWQDLLDRERVGADDDFFALGGHSLLLGRARARILDVFGAEISLRDLFEHRTVRRLAALVADTVRPAAAPRARLVAHPDPTAPAPLSFTQERLWLEEQLRPGDLAYNMPMVLRVRGPLDRPALQAAVDAVVRRHTVLRSAFEPSGPDGTPEQRAVPDARVVVREDDLRGRADAETLALAEAMRETKRPFDLTAPPLLRALVLRTADEEALLVVTVHHIAFDGWSFAVLLDELSEAYRTARATTPVGPAAPADALQFADAARHQRAVLDDARVAELLGWWSAHLAETPTVLELPTDRPRPAVQGHRGARLRMSVDAGTATRLRQLSQRSGATLYQVLLAAFGVVLSRYTGQERLLVGTPVANRELPEYESLLGPFLNTLPVPLDLRGAPAFTELLHRVREASLAGLAHQELPFGSLVGELVPERELSRSPLVQVLFALQNMRLGEFSAPGLATELVEVTEANSQFDLSLRMLDTGGEILGWLDYDTDLFEAATAVRLTEHLGRVLAAVADAPSVSVPTVDLLGADEHRLLEHDWNDTAVPWELERTLTSLLEEFGPAGPGAPEAAGRVAVRCADRELDYPELHRRANRLAHVLRGLDVGPDVVVGVHLERSVELMVALLAVLKAGGAYLPLDPSYPADRLGFMLADSHVPVLLVGPGQHPGSQADGGLVPEGVQVVEVGTEESADVPETAPRSDTGPDHLAYVIYTSGSTGRPKGVQVPHRGIVNRLLWMQDAYGLTAADTVLQKTPISFDVSVWELFWPLVTGARLVLAAPGGHRDPAYLAELIRQERVTVCHFVPPMLDTFLTAAPALPRDSLRLVVCSGEALPAELARRFHGELPGVALENLYGPTEASVDVTRWSSRPDWTRPTVPIGAPIANTRVHVLDPLLAPVPVGVAGELYLGGVQLARAYGGRPDLTADRFVPDPFAVGTSGARLYRTGDLARWRPDGVLEYLGRIDHQVKVRGFRIELGEIEAAIGAVPDVGQVVVIVREDAPGDRRIVAYLTAREPGGTVPDRLALRTALGRSLPEHMLPSAFVVLDALPLSPNGKVDRRALPVPEDGRTAEGGTHREAATDLERRLVRLWQQVLRLERIGATENFFEIGGDSMHAVRIVGLARAEGLDIPLTELFAHQTVEALAAWLDARTATVAAASQVAAFGLLSPADLAKLRAR